MLPLSLPKFKVVTLSRPVWVKGKGLPKDGVCLFNAGHAATLKTDNGADWYLVAKYRGKEIRVATIPSSL